MMAQHCSQVVGGSVGAAICMALAVAAATAAVEARGDARTKQLWGNMPALAATLLLMWEGAAPLVDHVLRSPSP